MYRQAAISPFIVFHLPTRTTWFLTRDSTALILEKGSVTKANKQKMKNNQCSVFVIFTPAHVKSRHKELKLWCLANNLREKKKMLNVLIQIKRKVYCKLK